LILESRFGARGRAALDVFLNDYQVLPLAFGDLQWRAAVTAFVRFGKGRHPAALNFGDCLTYATARLADRPLLCSGDDFRATDLEIA
jgi:ribonuclease VapC